MSIVPVKIHGREFQLACDEGQENHLKSLAEEVDGRVRELARGLPQANENLLVVMASLMLADELSDIKRMVRKLERQLEIPVEAPAAYSADEAKLIEMEAAMAETLRDVAVRIEKIAKTMEVAA